MSRRAKLSRRDWLKASAVAGAVIASPYFVPQSAFGANDRIITGHIGVKNQGSGNLKAFINNAAAVCDVDKEVLGKAVKTVEQTGRSCAGFEDYRRLLDRKDIDAVVISTPDHWHARMTIDACAAGKDVYCEKPLSLTISEGRKMVQAARQHNRIVQTGSQQRSESSVVVPEGKKLEIAQAGLQPRSDAKFRQACECVRSGRIGKVHTVLVGIPGPNHPGEPVPDTDPPPDLNYEMWLGPAPQRPYNVKRLHYNFRFFWDYSGGQMTNFGAHHIDIAQWGLGMDNSGPRSIEGTATFHPKQWHEVTETCRVTYQYAGDITMIVGQGQKDIREGTTFIGDKGKLHVDRSKLTADPADLIAEPLREGEVHLYASKNHHQNFLECIQSRELPICDVEIGHRSATACHLGNLAVRLGRKLQWDPAKEQFTGDDEANAMLARPYRSPWTI